MSYDLFSGIPHALCSLPHALCSMRYALCPMLFSLCALRPAYLYTPCQGIVRQIKHDVFGLGRLKN